MTRYFFHLRSYSDELLDSEGCELPNLEAARDQAIRYAQDTLSHEIREGRLNLSYRLDVEDSDGTIAHSLPFSEAFEVVGSKPA